MGKHLATCHVTMTTFPINSSPLIDIYFHSLLFFTHVRNWRNPKPTARNPERPTLSYYCATQILLLFTFLWGHFLNTQYLGVSKYLFFTINFSTLLNTYSDPWIKAFLCPVKCASYSALKWMNVSVWPSLPACEQKATLCRPTVISLATKHYACLWLWIASKRRVFHLHVDFFLVFTSSVLPVLGFFPPFFFPLTPLLCAYVLSCTMNYG